MNKDSIEKYLKENNFKEFRPKAVMFDMDGVIYDSMPNHARSWHTAMKRIGIDMPPEDAYKYEGMRGVETIKLLFRQQRGETITDAVAEEYYRIKSEEFNKCPDAQLMDGIKLLMRKIKDSMMKIVVVTGSAQHSLISKLTHDLNGLVSEELIVTAHDVEHGKPDPEPYLKGLAKAGAEPWEAIVVENAPLGVRAGVGARVFTVGVNTGPLPDSDLLNEGAGVIFSSIREFAENWKV